MTTFTVATANAANWVLAQAPGETPVGPDFGKASPIGLLLLVILGVVVLFIGWSFHRRFSRFKRRQAFAEARGIDPFDEKAIDAAMEKAGLKDQRKKSAF
ncbi:hypothetical protein [Corynebacterium mucifaciens]|uniref:Uncharacterized protein n=1 Tax=Corynebacterium mucifaciens TaxID=57171 RepID=A0A7X6LPF1_9CORY|nr:hypothetical protein [Corynebacterium mucifaciens]NKY67924.1 hypothetical protein [Corynebacterium mucifaciens]